MSHSPSPAPDERTGQQTGIAVMCLAMALLPVGDAISKLLTGIAAPFDVTVWRMVAQAACFVPIALFFRRRLGGRVLSLPTLISGALIVAVTFCLITAFQAMPIATAVSIFFIEPLLLTLLAGPFLGEVPGPRRYIAVGIGLIGALIVIRPNFAVFGPVVLLPVLGALGYALNMIVLRKARGRGSALSFQVGVSFSAAGLALLVYGMGALFGRQATSLMAAPSWAIGGVLAAGGLAALTFLLITTAFSKTEVSTLAPFQYFEIVGATIVGFAVFGNFPDMMTIFGTLIILGSGAYVFHRERRAGMPGRKAAIRSDR